MGTGAENWLILVKLFIQFDISHKEIFKTRHYMVNSDKNDLIESVFMKVRPSLGQKTIVYGISFNYFKNDDL